MNVSRQCPICGGTDFQQYITAEDHTVSHEIFNILQCATCKFLITSPIPENLGDYYLSPDYISHSEKAVTLADRVYQIARTFTMQWKEGLIRRQTANQFRKLLDYGCGTGSFLHYCQQKGWTIAGVEPSNIAREVATKATGHNIASNIQHLDSTKFDIITLWHVLEHIPDLNETLAQLKDKLTDSGTMFIAVPNHKSFDASYYLQHWAAYDVPRHLWHFSRTTMTQLLNAHDLKLIKILPMKLDAYYVSLLSEKNKTQGRSALTHYIQGMRIGLKSNVQAQSSQEYSSLIYIATR